MGKLDELLGKWSTLIVYGIILLASCMSAYLLYANSDFPYYEDRLKLHNEILQGTALAPFRYRVLVPNVTELIFKGALVYLPPKKAFLISYVLYDLIAFLLLFGTLFWYLRIWFSKEKSLLGILLGGSTIPVVLRAPYFHPWSYLEPGLFTLALGLIYKNHFKWLAIVTILSSLNRETAVFIPLAFLFAHMDVGAGGILNIRWSRTALIRFCILGLLWLLTYGGIRLIQGDAIRVLSVAKTWEQNFQTTGLMRSVSQNFFFGILLYPLAILGFRNCPSFVKKTSLLIPFYLVIFAVYAWWWQVRLFMTLYPILVPIALSSLSLNRSAEQSTFGGRGEAGKDIF